MTRNELNEILGAMAAASPMDRELATYLLVLAIAKNLGISFADAVAQGMGTKEVLPPSRLSRRPSK